MGDSRTTTVQTEQGPVLVRKLALGDYAELLRALKKLPAKLTEAVKDKDKDSLRQSTTVISIITEIAGDAIDDLCAVLAVATDKDAEFFVRSDLADALDVLAAILELNDYERIAESLKKMTARKRPELKGDSAPAPSKQ